MFRVLVTGTNKCCNKNDKNAITFPYFLVTGSRSEDGVPDMTIISNIDEKGINRNLRVRYERDIIYVSQSHILLEGGGTLCVCVKPTSKNIGGRGSYYLLGSQILMNIR